MIRVLVATCLALALFILGSMPAEGADWRFRRSYYSHHVPRQWRAHYPVPQSRSAYRPAYVTPVYGLSVRGGYRINRVQINSGGSSDTTILYEGWFGAR